MPGNQALGHDAAAFAPLVAKASLSFWQRRGAAIGNKRAMIDASA